MRVERTYWSTWVSIGKTFAATTSICGSMSGISMVGAVLFKGFVRLCINSFQ